MIKISAHSVGYCRFVVAVVLWLGCGSVSAEEERYDDTSISDHVVAGTKEYLSDPARVGSLSGSILMSSLLTHPWAPLLGSVAGFFIGKHSDFSREDDKAQEYEAYANRSIIPGDKQVAGTISLHDGSIEQPTQTVSLQPSQQQPASAAPQRPDRPQAVTALTHNPRSTDSFQQDMAKPEFQPGGTMHQIMAALCYNQGDGGPNRLPIDRDPCFYYRQ